jgi:hypothetical protein
MCGWSARITRCWWSEDFLSGYASKEVSKDSTVGGVDTYPIGLIYLLKAEV